MFNKFKNRLNENSSLSHTPSIINTSITNKKKSVEKIDQTESGASEDNQSSDDNIIQNSKQIRAESNNQNLSPNIDREVVNDLNGSTETCEKNLLLTNKIQLQEFNRSLLKEIDKLHIEINEKNLENEELRIELVKLKNKLKEKEKILDLETEQIQIMKQEFDEKINNLLNEKEELLIKNGELSKKYECLKLLNTKQSDAPTFSQSFEKDILKTSKNSSTSDDFSDEIKSLKEELNEKNKTITNLQHRLNDLKKTLQKELKYHKLPNEKKSESLSELQNAGHNSLNLNNQISPVASNTSSINNNLSLSDKPINKFQNSSLKKNHSLDMRILHDDVNFKYLKHVVLKFLTSREYEAIHLVKALSVLLNLSKDEEKTLKSTLEWKMSWFGVKPKAL